MLFRWCVRCDFLGLRPRRPPWENQTRRPTRTVRYFNALFNYFLTDSIWASLPDNSVTTDGITTMALRPRLQNPQQPTLRSSIRFLDSYSLPPLKWWLIFEHSMEHSDQQILPSSASNWRKTWIRLPNSRISPVGSDSSSRKLRRRINPYQNYRSAHY